MVSQSNLMKYTEKQQQCPFIPNRTETSLKPQVTFNDMDTAYRTELKYLGTCSIENLKCDVQVRTLRPPQKEVCDITKSLG
jgi:hypothetical protein